MIIVNIGNYKYAGVRVFEVCFFSNRFSRNIQIILTVAGTEQSTRCVLKCREFYRASSPVKEILVNKTYSRFQK
jgi:hypothetical protein